MDEFLIPSAAGDGGLLFFERTPRDLSEPIHSFWVRVTDHNLTAATQVYAGYSPSHPAALFAEMARKWDGWSGELVWQSLESEFSMRCGRDRAGHIFLRVELRLGLMPENWAVKATVFTEAGQLDAIAKCAVLFFGRAG